MLHPSRSVAGVVLALTAAVTLAHAGFTAPSALAAPRPQSTTTTSSTSSTSTTSTSTTSTTVPPKPKPTVPPTSTTTAPPTTTTTAPPPPLEPGQVPPEVQAMIDAYPRTPARSTDAVVDLTAPLDGIELKPSQYATVFGRFPVAGRARYSHDWIFPRHVPDFHVHEGTDVFADRGTPVLAPTAGRVRTTHGAVGGLSVHVVQPDGTYWYLAHLDAIADGISDGTEVVAGQVVGTVGDSGNAAGGAPHVHVEVHPHGGGPLDPKPLLDQYLDEALREAPAKVMRLVALHGPFVRPTKLDPLPEDTK